MNNIHLSKISIIIPYFKNQETIFSLLKSLRDCSFQNNQILIIDDSPNDKILEEVVLKYRGIKILKNKKNSGVAFSRNLGIRETKTPYLLFLDADLTFKPQDIVLLVRNLNNFDIVFPKKTYHDGTLISPANTWEKRHCMAGAVFLAKRKSLEKLDEFFDENYFLYGEDSDFFLRCQAFGLKFKYIPESVFVHPKKIIYSEKIYYFRTRNVIYFPLKFVGIIKYRLPLLLYLTVFTLLNFIMAILNRHIDFPPPKIQKRSFYSQRPFSRLRLLFFFLKAIFWNIKNLPVIFEKRRRLNQSLKS